MEIIANNLQSIPIDESWAYSNKSQANTSYLTHAYYTYPAKFIPQIAHRLIIENSEKGDTVVDPFMGSGTTVLEALINDRVAIGVDVNKVAYLLTKVKTTPLCQNILIEELSIISNDLNHRMNGHFAFYSRRAKSIIPENPRIDHWFTDSQKKKLSIILKRINEIDTEEYREFFLIAFAQILKPCSRWLQTSIKPQRDPDKTERDPLSLFLNQSQKMSTKNAELVDFIGSEKMSYFTENRKLSPSDCRDIPCRNSSIDLIVTSPPYVTSYEYADLHQLPTIWFRYADELSDFRTRFIGSTYRKREQEDLMSSSAEHIVGQLESFSEATEVRCYFSDMIESFMEMKRILKTRGRLCIVIGNTRLRGVDIQNAEVFCEQLKNLNFIILNVIRREISSKMLPSLRDPVTGRFAHSKTKKKVLIHPEEFIIIAEKI